MIEAAKLVLDEWGLHYCCARSRLTIEPIVKLESELSSWFKSPALTFPSVTSTHSSALPLLAAGKFFLEDSASENFQKRKSTRIIFDRFAHASMQVLKPILAKHSTVVTIGHNDLEELQKHILEALSCDEIPIYCADSVYSMGGTAPLRQLFELAEKYPLVLYLDDAHGTSIFGPQGQGYVSEFLADRPWPNYLWMTFSLAKGFGCNGGGIVCPTESARSSIMRFGQTFAFSGPIDFAMAGAALRGLELHKGKTLNQRQELLRKKVALIDEHLYSGETLPFSPIRMVEIGDENTAIEMGRALLDAGFYVPVVFHPVVPRGKAQLRICITILHEDQAITSLCKAIKSLQNQNSTLRPSPQKKSVETQVHVTN